MSDDPDNEVYRACVCPVRTCVDGVFVVIAVAGIGVKVEEEDKDVARGQDQDQDQDQERHDSSSLIHGKLDLRRLHSLLGHILHENTHHRVLLFEPVSSYHRFLIHNAVEDYSELKSFSIGKGKDRRTVVCFENQIINNGAAAFSDEMKVEQPLQNHVYSGQDDGVYRPPAARRLQQQQQPQISSKSRENKQRRPDREVYVPRGRRQLVETPPQQPTNPPPPDPVTPKVRKSHDKTFCNIYRPPHARHSDDSVRTAEVKNSESKEDNGVDGHIDPSPDLGSADNATHHPEECLTFQEVVMADPEPESNPEPLHHLIDDTRTWNVDKDEDGERKELKRATEEINRSNRRLIKQSFDSDILIITDPTEDSKRELPKMKLEKPVQTDSEDEARSLEAPKNKYNPEEDEWESLLDENVECLEPSLLAELNVAVGKVSVQRCKVPVISRSDNYAHVLEIYDFPASFTTVDLYSAFAEFKDKGFEIIWVDDTHALAVFSGPKIAAEVLMLSHSFIKTRPLHEGTAASKQKAKKRAEFLQPYRPRPETCPALARRLVTGALGVKLATAREERIEEKRVLTEAREKKRLAARNREAAWEGTIPSQIN